jgi:tripartite ATP-independent transporter DctP family solute receptor
MHAIETLVRRAYLSTFVFAFYGSQRKRESGENAMLNFLFAAALAVVSATAAQAQDIHMKLAHYAAESHPGCVASRMFAEAVQKRTQGKIEISVHCDNELGSPPALLEMAIKGDLDMALPSQGQLGLHSKKFNCVMLPFSFDSYAHADSVLDGPFAEWTAAEYGRLGLVFLANWEWGFRNLTNSNRPVNTPSDVRGLTIRIPPGLPYRAAMEALGAIVATVDFNDLQKALAEGVTNAEENPIAVIYSNRVYEVHKHLAMTGHTYNSMVHVISKKAWGKLTREQQAIVREESVNAGRWMRAAIRQAEGEQIERMKADGVQVTYPDRAKFKALMKPAIERMKAAVGEENVSAFMKMADGVR